jgi:hypothetical protein
MGCTVMPYSHVLGQEHGRWKEFRKGLTKEDQVAFDRLFDRVKFHTAAGVYLAHPYPLETILLSICLEHEKMLGEILGKINSKERVPVIQMFFRLGFQSEERRMSSICPALPISLNLQHMPTARSRLRSRLSSLVPGMDFSL